MRKVIMQESRPFPMVKVNCLPLIDCLRLNEQLWMKQIEILINIQFQISSWNEQNLQISENRKYYSYFTLLITKWSVWLFFDLQERTKLPGCDAQSRMRKSPSDFNNSSVFCLGIGPWYHACERKSLESNANSHSNAFFIAMASWEIGLSIEGESCGWIRFWDFLCDDF